MKRLLCLLLAGSMCWTNLYAVEENSETKDTFHGMEVVTEDSYQPVSPSVSKNMKNAEMGDGLKKEVSKAAYQRSSRSVSLPKWNADVNGKYFYDGYGNLLFNGPSKMIIDVSEWQETIDWEKVKAAGVDGVILRLGYGYLGKDAYFDRNLSECNRLGIPYGIYLFSYAYDANFAYAEANGTAQMLEGKDLSNLKYPIYYDIEGFGSWKDDDGSIRKAPTTAGQYESIIGTYINRMSELGYGNLVQVYSYRAYAKGTKDKKAPLESEKILPYLTWIAEYDSPVLNMSNPYCDGDVAWQYSSSEKVNGVKGNTDTSAFPSAAFTVKPYQVILSDSSVTLSLGATKTVNASVNPFKFADQGVMWSSSDNSIASVEQNGTIHANKSGTATITAYASNNVSASVQVTVTGPSVSMPSSKTLYKSKSAKLAATATNGAAIQWSSSNSGVARVDANGNVKGIKAGTAYITASIDGASAQCKITVKNPTIKLNKKSATAYKKVKYTLKATTSYKTKVTWKSSNKKVATVNSKGVVTPKKKGKVTITATAYGKKVTCKLTIKNPSLKVNKSKVTIKRKKSYTVKAKAVPNKKISWSSKNKKIATVNSKGKITGKKKGTTYIYAKVNGLKKTIKVKVK